MKASPKMVSLARKARGYSQKELADLVGKTPAAISKMEKGLLEISDESLEAFSKALGFPLSLFSQKEEEYPMAVPMHRKKAKLSKKALDQIETSANLSRVHFERLLDQIEISRSLPFYDVDEYGDPAEIARMTRIHLRVPKGPIRSMTSTIEKAGVAVVKKDFGTDLIDGFCLFCDTPMIFVNQSIPGDRLRFTLAHELGHMVMHTAPTPSCEDEANLFASEFLMPQIEIEDDLKNLSYKHVFDLKRYWRVSLIALVVWAHKMGAIDKNRYKYLCMRLSSDGYRRKEPIEIPREEPALFKSIIKTHLNELGWSIEETAKSLSLYVEEFADTYLEGAKQLRLVKA